MGLRRKKTAEQRQAAAAKWLRRLDPGAASSQASVFDAQGGRLGRLRQAQRDYALIREQKETNRLLREQAERRE